MRKVELAGKTESNKLDTFNSKSMTWNIKCQAYNCDWETNLMHTTVKKQCIKIHSHQGLNDRSLTGMISNHKTATTHPKPHWF